MFSQSPKCAGTLTQPRYLLVLEDGVPDGENAVVAICAAAITIMSVSTIGAVNGIHLHLLHPHHQRRLPPLLHQIVITIVSVSSILTSSLFAP